MTNVVYLRILFMLLRRHRAQAKRSFMRLSRAAVLIIILPILAACGTDFGQYKFDLSIFASSDTEIYKSTGHFSVSYYANSDFLGSNINVNFRGRAIILPLSDEGYVVALLAKGNQAEDVVSLPWLPVDMLTGLPWGYRSLEKLRERNFHMLVSAELPLEKIPTLIALKDFDVPSKAFVIRPGVEFSFSGNGKKFKINKMTIIAQNKSIMDYTKSFLHKIFPYIKSKSEITNIDLDRFSRQIVKSGIVSPPMDATLLVKRSD